MIYTVLRFGSMTQDVVSGASRTTVTAEKYGVLGLPPPGDVGQLLL